MGPIIFYNMANIKNNNSIEHTSNRKIYYFQYVKSETKTIKKHSKNGKFNCIEHMIIVS